MEAINDKKTPKRMEEPTHREFKFLCKLDDSKKGFVRMNYRDREMRIVDELFKNGYVIRIPSVSGNFDCIVNLSEKGREYIENSKHPTT